jgi:hypothetical protein
MKLFAVSGLSIGAFGIVLALMTGKPVAPGCSDTRVIEMVKTSIAQSPAGQQMNVVLSGISDETGTLANEQWQCSAHLQTSKGIFPVQYDVGLLGPIQIEVTVTASFAAPLQSVALLNASSQPIASH